MDFNKIIQESSYYGYFFHSSSLVDKLWLDLGKLNSLMKIKKHREYLTNCIGEIIKQIFEKNKEEDKINTILYFDNTTFQFDTKLEISLTLKDELINILPKSFDFFDFYHCMIKNNTWIEDENNLQIILEDKFNYNAILFFPTSFHSYNTKQVIQCLKEQWKINIKGVIFFVFRHDDEKKDKIREGLEYIPFYKLFKISKDRIYFNGKYLTSF